MFSKFMAKTAILSKFYEMFECIHHPFHTRGNDWQSFIQSIQKHVTRFFKVKVQQEKTASNREVKKTHGKTTQDTYILISIFKVRVNLEQKANVVHDASDKVT